LRTINSLGPGRRANSDDVDTNDPEHELQEPRDASEISRSQNYRCRSRILYSRIPDEARRIAANIAKLPELSRKRQSDVKLKVQPTRTILLLKDAPRHVGKSAPLSGDSSFDLLTQVLRELFFFIALLCSRALHHLSSGQKEPRRSCRG
jgi:hypothetical protein